LEPPEREPTLILVLWCGNNLAQRSFKALQEFGHGPQARPQIRSKIRALLSSAAGSGGKQ
jgi:hypothetical protein